MLGAPPWNPAAAIEHWYPEISTARAVASDAASPAVLVLGGSVVAPEYSPVSHALQQQLPGWKVCSVGELSHTSRDSLIKYEALDNRFDVVVWHHAINDHRANNYPAEVFQPDYGHMTWYAEVNTWNRHRRHMAGTVAPFMLDLVVARWRSAIAAEGPMWERWPTPEMAARGGELKTPAAYRANLERVLFLARERGQRVVVVTMPYRLPADYSHYAMITGKLGYSPGGLPVALWGEPAHVAEAIDAHNAVARKLVAHHPHAVLVDLAETMPRDGRLWLDICHLSPEGAQLWAWTVAPAVR